MHVYLWFSFHHPGNVLHLYTLKVYLISLTNLGHRCVSDPPLKPNNVTCIAVQVLKDMSSKLACSWDPGTRKPLLPTSYTLYAKAVPDLDIDK